LFKDSLDLHKFAKAALPYKAMEVADPAILLHEGTQGRDAPNATLVRSRTEDCLASAIGLGVSCSKKWPRERMLVQDAAVQMRAVRDAYLNVCHCHGSLLDGSLEETTKPPFNEL